MPFPASTSNALGHFRDGVTARADGGKWPVPLAATRIDVTIRGGLAIVATERIFRNAEPRSIEATMTFPIPVDATLCALSARIDGRTLHAVAQIRSSAREHYEDAVDAGRAAVLHEELLKGVHMLSVGQIRPGAEIAVMATWTAPLSFIGDTPRLRIPTTISDIYGQTPLSPSDDLVAGGAVQLATIAIVCDGGVATILGAGAANDGRHTVMLDHPIDVAVTGFAPTALRGVAADGREVTLTIEPMARAADPLAVDLLFDRSGSMTERASGHPKMTGTKFEVAKAVLLAVAHNHLKPADRVQLWEFNDSVTRLGEASGAGIAALVQQVDEPAGGTEVGRAFAAVAANSRNRNVIVITDGLSWALDPRRIKGLRVTTVLIGENALEAGIGALAAITGGQVFVAAGSDAAAAIVAAFDAARAPQRPRQTIDGSPSRVEAFVRGGRLVAEWGPHAAPAPSTETTSREARLIGATAAMLAIPQMPESDAADLAAREGIVCHLTSLVLVDETGTAHAGIPATRKIALSTPRTAAHGLIVHALAAPPPPQPSAAPAACGRPGWPGRWREILDRVGAAPSDRAASPPRPQLDLGGALARIDWDADPDALTCGDLSLLLPNVAALIAKAARLPAIDALARAADLDPVVAVIALLARAAGNASRSAGRIARNLIGDADAEVVARAMAALRLRSLSPAP